MRADLGQRECPFCERDMTVLTSGRFVRHNYATRSVTAGGAVVFTPIPGVKCRGSKMQPDEAVKQHAREKQAAAREQAQRLLDAVPGETREVPADGAQCGLCGRHVGMRDGKYLPHVPERESQAYCDGTFKTPGAVLVELAKRIKEGTESINQQRARWGLAPMTFTPTGNSAPAPRSRVKIKLGPTGHAALAWGPDGFTITVNEATVADNCEVSVIWLGDAK